MEHVGRFLVKKGLTEPEIEVGIAKQSVLACARSRLCCARSEA